MIFRWRENVLIAHIIYWMDIALLTSCMHGRQDDRRAGRQDGMGIHEINSKVNDQRQGRLDSLIEVRDNGMKEHLIREGHPPSEHSSLYSAFEIDISNYLSRSNATAQHFIINGLNHLSLSPAEQLTVCTSICR